MKNPFANLFKKKDAAAPEITPSTGGKPKKENPIRFKILDKKLHWKLLLNPDLYLGEAYTNGSIVIENGTLTEFLDIALKNVGRQSINSITNISGKFRISLNNFLYAKATFGHVIFLDFL